MAKSNVLIKSDVKIPKEEGNYHRLICMTGPNKGKTYFLKGDKVVIGRGDECDIQIADVKASRMHAELKKKEERYVITDLGGQNGVVLNNEGVKQQQLNDGDKFIIGASVFIYNFVVIARDLAVVKDLEKLEDEVEALKKGKEKKASEKKKSPVLMIVIVLAGAYFLMSDDKPAENKLKSQKKEAVAEDPFLEALIRKNQKDDEEVKKKLNEILQKGQREFREGNYFRAMEEFNQAKLLNPSDGRANFYYNRSKQRLDEDVENNFIKARQDMDALKFQSAMNAYCTVMRMLKDYPDDQRFKDAQTSIGLVEEKMGMNKGEAKCFEK